MKFNGLKQGVYVEVCDPESGDLVKRYDYKASCKKAKTGSVRVTVKGKSYYCGIAEIKVPIIKRDIASVYKKNSKIPDQKYTGKAIKPVKAKSPTYYDDDTGDYFKYKMKNKKATSCRKALRAR